MNEVLCVAAILDPTLRESRHSVLFVNMKEVKDKAKLETHLKTMPTLGKNDRRNSGGTL